MVWRKKMSNRLVSLVYDLAAAKQRKAELAEQTKELNKLIQKLSEKDIPEYMDENEIEKLSVEGVGTVFIQNKVYANVKVADKPKFFAWLRENDNQDLIKEDVNAKTLGVFAKEQLEAGTELPEFISARIYPTAQLRKKP
jgi:hypothetical protein